MNTEPKIVYVDSWRDIPGEHDSSISAYTDLKTKTIYAIKGKTPESDIQHELFHAKQTTINKYMRKKKFINPVMFVREELEATKYAYDKTGNPKHIVMKLRAIYNDLCFNRGNMKSSNAFKIIGKELKLINPPKEWLVDYSRMMNK